MELGKLGTAPNDQGGYTYEHERNPLLIQGIHSYNFGIWRPTRMNPVMFATLAAATAIAKVLGGEVVPDPVATNFNLLAGPFGPAFPVSQVYAVKLPNGFIFNAGYVCGVMGNDVAFNSMERKSQVICEEQLFMPVDPMLAEKLWVAFAPILPK